MKHLLIFFCAFFFVTFAAIDAQAQFGKVGRDLQSNPDYSFNYIGATRTVDTYTVRMEVLYKGLSTGRIVEAKHYYHSSGQIDGSAFLLVYSKHRGTKKRGVDYGVKLYDSVDRYRPSSKEFFSIN